MDSECLHTDQLELLVVQPFVAVPAHWSHSRFKLGSISVPIDTGVVPWPQAAARRDFPNRYSDNGILL